MLLDSESCQGACPIPRTPNACCAQPGRNTGVTAFGWISRLCELFSLRAHTSLPVCKVTDDRSRVTPQPKWTLIMCLLSSITELTAMAYDCEKT